MSRNGTGTYVLPAGNPVVTGTTISSTWANTTLNDIGTALTTSIATDGQTIPSANLPMGGFIHTNVGNATVRTNYANAGQVQDGVYQYLTSVSGTNTIVATASLAMTAYAAGQAFRFISSATNTGATTLNINGIGATPIGKNGKTAAGAFIVGQTYIISTVGTTDFVAIGASVNTVGTSFTATGAGTGTGTAISPLTAGDIQSNSIVQVFYDGVEFQLISAGSLSLSSNNVWTGSNTFSDPLTLPIGTTLQRPEGTQGEVRYNTTLGQYEANTQVAGATISTITNSGLTATLTTSTNHNLVSNTYIVVSGATPSAYNGGFKITVLNATQFQYTMLTNPGGNASVVGSYVYAAWGQLGGGATGGNGDQVFNLNSLTVTNSYSIPSGKSAMSTGPLVINSGVTVTVPSGSKWVVL